MDLATAVKYGRRAVRESLGSLAATERDNRVIDMGLCQ